MGMSAKSTGADLGPVARGVGAGRDPGLSRAVLYSEWAKSKLAL